MKSLSRQMLVQFADSRVSPDKADLWYFAMKRCPFDLTNYRQFQNMAEIHRIPDNFALRVELQG